MEPRTDAANPGIAPGALVCIGLTVLELISRRPVASSISNRSASMSRGFPSMTALLGLLAVAGYQNRDKIAEMLRGVGSNPNARLARSARRHGAATRRIGRRAQPVGQHARRRRRRRIPERRPRRADGPLQTERPGRRRGLLGRYRSEQALPAPDLEQAIGPDVLATLSQQTGLSQQELLARLSRELPNAVDKYTPQGRLPTDADFAR